MRDDPELDKFLTLAAKWMGDWYPLALFSVCVNILFVFLHPLLVESPRWLLTKGRVTEAAEIINNIRKINNQEQVMELEEKLRPIAEQENQQARDSLGPLDIFKNLVIFRYVDNPHVQNIFSSSKDCYA